MGVKIHRNLLDDYRAQTLPAREFKRQFEAAMRGETNDLSPFVKPWNERMCQSEWARVRSSIFRRDNYTCRYCGARAVALECDHIMPLARGGSNEPENLTTACKPCNRSKRDKTLEEWRSGTN